MAAEQSLTTLSDAYSKYLNAEAQTEHVTVAEAEALARDIAIQATVAGLKPDVVVGLANGAFLPAKIVADSLNVPFHMVKVRRQGSRYKQKLLFIKQKLKIPSELILWGPFRILWDIFQNRTSKLESSADSFDFDVKGQHVLVVDDAIVTGSSLRYVNQRLLDGGALDVRTAVYCWALMPDIDDSTTRPDIYLHRQIQFYPWSGNSNHEQKFMDWLSAHNLVLWK